MVASPWVVWKDSWSSATRFEVMARPGISGSTFSGSPALFADNIIESNQAAGIYLASSSVTLTIQGNTIESNSGKGVSIGDLERGERLHGRPNQQHGQREWRRWDLRHGRDHHRHRCGEWRRGQSLESLSRSSPSPGTTIGGTSEGDDGQCDRRQRGRRDRSAKGARGLYLRPAT